jgi:hypothetical protein
VDYFPNYRSYAATIDDTWAWMYGALLFPIIQHKYPGCEDCSRMTPFKKQLCNDVNMRYHLLFNEKKPWYPYYMSYNNSNHVFYRIKSSGFSGLITIWLTEGVDYLNENFYPLPDMQCTKPVQIAEATMKNKLACGTEYVANSLKEGDEQSLGEYCYHMPTSPEEPYVKCRDKWYTCVSSANADAQAAVSIVSTIGLVLLVFLAHKLLLLPSQTTQSAEPSRATQGAQLDNPLRVGGGDGTSKGYDDAVSYEEKNEDEDDKSKFAVAAEQEEAHLFREAIQRRFVDQESQLAEQQRRFADQESRLADQERRFADQESRLVHQAAQLKTMALTLKKTQATELERQARAGFGQAIPLAKAEASDDEIFVETTSTDANASDDGKDEGDGEDEDDNEASRRLAEDEAEDEAEASALRWRASSFNRPSSKTGGGSSTGGGGAI